MEYNFTRHEPVLEKRYFAMVLDKQSKKERILIGTEIEIELALQNKKTNIEFDKKRPLGSFLIELENDFKQSWNENIMKLYESLNSNRWKQPVLEQEVASFLSAKIKDNSPTALYTAFRVWNDYLIAREPRDRNVAAEAYIDTLTPLPAAFYFADETLPPKLRERATTLIPPYKKAFASDKREHSQLHIVYPTTKSPTECVLVYDSFKPLVSYYLKRLDEWGLKFIECQRCGKFFLATSKHHTLCSDKCKKEQKSINKQEHNARTEDLVYEQMYKNAYSYWQNRVRKLRNKGISDDMLADFKQKITAIRKDAVKKKEDTARRRITEKEFSDYLFKTMSEVDDLVENIVKCNLK